MAFCLNTWGKLCTVHVEETSMPTKVERGSVPGWVFWDFKQPCALHVNRNIGGGVTQKAERVLRNSLFKNLVFPELTQINLEILTVTICAP